MPELDSDAVAVVSPETLNLCATVAGRDAGKMDDLITSALAGDLTREDLRSASRAAREARREAGERLPTNGHTALKAEDRTEDSAEKITAADVLVALRRNQDWVGSMGQRPHVPRKYYVFDEFRAATGSSRAARRMDAMVAETLTTDEDDMIILVGVEIKVSVSDLKGDTKMAEYGDFVDKFFIAVPDSEEMIVAAEEVRLPTWGVLAINSAGVIRAIRGAAINPGLFRDKTLTAALIKMI